MNKIYIPVFLFASILISSCDYKIPALAGSYAYSEDYRFNISKKELINKIKEFKSTYPQYKSYDFYSDTLQEDLDYYEWSENTDPVRIDYENGAYSYITPRGYSDTLTKNSIWFHCSFFFTDIKANVGCVINVSQKAIGTPTLLSFVSYSPDGRNWKTINQRGDISREENRMIKKKFETEILDKLGVKWRHQRW
ncbi:MAG: hypothetical protein LBT48_07660 [Prevotellaceae bacterium]|jgi:hypothetical protein|nr:hypothetical protein [Prevotellaceae bacterium]